MRNTHIGIIGGGQLGMLLVQSAIQFPAHVSVYDPSDLCPAAYFTQRFTKGRFDDTDAIIAFGEPCDVILFETEQTSLEALAALEAQGKKVFSSRESLEWIQNKLTQREKLQNAGFPVPSFTHIDGKDVRSYDGNFPIVQKWHTGGYDGLGVSIHENKNSLQEAHEIDSIFEEKIAIRMELSVLIARDEKGNIALYDPVEMVFHEQANLVNYIVSPARISDDMQKQVCDLCRDLATTLNFIGMYAVEIFISDDDKIFVNEVSPRPHNSGHHTISANLTSQYEQQIRIALGLPLGAATQITPCVLLNLLADETTGKTHYKGLEDAYAIPHVQYTLYGKSEVRPHRKMGHALIVENNIDDALAKIKDINTTLTITAYE